MTERSEPGNRIGRILTLVGDLLREMGGLVGEPRAHEVEAPAPAPAAQPASAPVAEPAPAPAPAPVPVAAPVAVAPPEPEPEPAPSTVARSEEELFLLCELGEAKIALPYAWVVGTRLSLDGTPEGFTISDGHGERELRVTRVLGLFTRREIAETGEPVRWAGSASEITGAPAPRPAPDAPSTPEPAAQRPTLAMALEKHALEGCRPEEPRHAWIVSPSALARRFLMRHLVDLGFEVLEARDLDDPMLPADLKGVTALFLDESLLEDWRARSQTSVGHPLLVLLTVDGALSVPPDGATPPQGAVLPRPFERSEVERVVHWLCSLRRGVRGGGSSEHGDEEDDTWLFADPFGAARTGEHSRS